MSLQEGKMSKFFFASTCFLITFCFLAGGAAAEMCSTPIRVEPTKVTIPAEDQGFWNDTSFDIYADFKNVGCTWDAFANPGSDWLNLVGYMHLSGPGQYIGYYTLGVGSGAATFEAEEWDGDRNRVGYVTVGGQSIKVVQLAKEPWDITFNPDPVEASWRGGNQTISVSTSGDWNVSSQADWIDVESSVFGFNDNAVITITVEENKQEIARNAQLVFTEEVLWGGSGDKAYLDVNQEAYNSSEDVWDITFSNPVEATWNQRNVDVSVKTETESWNCESTVDWINVENAPQGFSYNEMLTLFLDENRTDAERTGQIRFTREGDSPNNEALMDVVQAPYNVFEDPSLQPVHRFYNSQTKAHFYTINEAEKEMIIEKMPEFSYDGPAFQAFTQEVPEGDPIFRFFNTKGNAHFFTNSAAEKAMIMEKLPEYTYEMECYYAYSEEINGAKPLFRFFNTKTGLHFYTATVEERDLVIEQYPQYVYEGIAYYVMPLSESTPAPRLSMPKQ
jgi:hypothetical protein